MAPQISVATNQDKDKGTQRCNLKGHPLHRRFKSCKVKSPTLKRPWSFPKIKISPNRSNWSYLYLDGVLGRVNWLLFYTNGTLHVKIGKKFWEWQDSNPGQLGEKRELYICATLFPIWFMDLGMSQNHRDCTIYIERACMANLHNSCTRKPYYHQQTLS